MRLVYFSIGSTKSQGLFITFYGCFLGVLISLPRKSSSKERVGPQGLEVRRMLRAEFTKFLKKCLTNDTNRCIMHHALGRLAQLARASAWRAEGHRFESYIVHQKKKSSQMGWLFLLVWYWRLGLEKGGSLSPAAFLRGNNQNIKRKVGFSWKKPLTFQNSFAKIDQPHWRGLRGAPKTPRL